MLCLLVLFSFCLNVYAQTATQAMCEDYCHGIRDGVEVPFIRNANPERPLGGIIEACTGTNAQFVTDPPGGDPTQLCMDTCMQYRDDGDRIHETPIDDDNTWQCRMAHLEYVRLLQQSPTRHCAHAGPDGGGVCIQKLGPDGRPTAQWLGIQAVEAKFADIFNKGNNIPAAAAGVFQLAAFRLRMQLLNIHDPYTQEEHDANKAQINCPASSQKYRTADGTCNNQIRPDDGMAWSRFARQYYAQYNEPGEFTSKAQHKAMMNDPPIWKVAEFVARWNNRGFQPSPLLNVLAGAWLQFNNHDWFNHARDTRCRDATGRPVCNESNKDYCTEVQVNERGDKFCLENTLFDAEGYGLNEETHWWDASQLYGSSQEEQDRVKDGMYIKSTLVNGEQFLERDAEGPITGLAVNWWTGLEIMHTIFVREHNHVADRIKAENPSLTDEEIFQTTRLCISAIIAKIHTIDWTPAVLNNPIMRAGLRANWFGLPAVIAEFGDAVDPNLLTGVLGGVPLEEFLAQGGFEPIGGPVYDWGVPHQMTEEFVAVYRMHPLLPDWMNHKNETMSLHDLYFERNWQRFQADGLSEWLKSFGLGRAGHLQTGNYPQTLLDLAVPDGRRLNMAAVDIFRDRERGVPRFREFRRAMQKNPPLDSFDQLSESVEFNEAVKELYGGDIDKIDSLIGQLGEGFRPAGFGFSDTTFRLFLILATRRLWTDRFFKDSFNVESYTQTGIDYVTNTGFKEILLRHCPELEPYIGHVNEASPSGPNTVFHPWRTPTNARRRADPHFAKNCQDGIAGACVPNPVDCPTNGNSGTGSTGTGTGSSGGTGTVGQNCECPRCNGPSQLKWNLQFNTYKGGCAEGGGCPNIESDDEA
eukprot:TRINITY_DN67485_c4_g6_i1.p1 TRINITY_DN67485_c4_g6~~TRINITY_DN67485_c4_g6_i1.p1  ORF type:complete len:866 (+),score=98.68 TRINITY_DN67485_c4_g6_i1:38-2635(+)